MGEISLRKIFSLKIYRFISFFFSVEDSGHHESPLSEDIRKIYREAIGRGESSQARALDRHSHSGNVSTCPS